MKWIFFIALLVVANMVFAQGSIEKTPFERKGFLIGFGLGAGTLTLNHNDTIQTSFSATLPNIKFGWMISNRIALQAILPGATYKYGGKDRGFEGIIISGQYWLKDKWWLMGGTGVTFDAPAFYTVQSPNSAGFYTGIPAFTFATGYEVWRKDKFALDVQYRVFLGQSSLSNNQQRQGISNMFIIGFNWY